MRYLITVFTNSSILYQLILGIGFVLTALMSTFTYVTTTNQSDFLYAQGVEQAKKRNMMLGTSAKAWVLSNDYIGLEEVVHNFEIYDDLIFASVMNMDGKIIAHSDRSKVGQYVSDEKRISYLKKMLEPITDHNREEKIFAQNDKYIDIVNVIHNGDMHIGVVHLRLDQSIRHKNIDSIVIQGIIFTFISLIIGVFFAFLTANSLTKRLSELISAMKDIRHGSKNVRVEVHGAKEVRQLSREFNLMLDTIRENEKKIQTANTKAHNQEEIMISQSRHAAMGEMISMIAHQWRQPISVIAMGANNILADVKLEMINEDSLLNNAENIINQTQELSKTIDDFRNFFKPVQVSQEILPEDVLSEALGVIGKSIENNNIEVVIEAKETKSINTYSRELMQVLINILNNAKEVLVARETENKKIFIFIQDNNNEVIIEICDNGGGIQKDIQDKIFDPYFTTKGTASGTGLGLYMSKTIIEKHLKGSLNTYNKDNGACFRIRLPYTIK